MLYWYDGKDFNQTSAYNLPGFFSVNYAYMSGEWTLFVP